jgi:hypothetical protein
METISSSGSRPGLRPPARRMHLRRNIGPGVVCREYPHRMGSDPEIRSRISMVALRTSGKNNPGAKTILGLQPLLLVHHKEESQDAEEDY